MNITTWLLFGVIIGIIADILDPRDGLLGPIILGLLGSLLGLFMASLLSAFTIGEDSRFMVWTLSSAGALLLFAISRFFKFMNR